MVTPCYLTMFMQFMNGKLSDLLSAYRTDYRTQYVLLHTIEEWKVALDNGQHVGVVLMDLSKAFDAIPHSLLLTKLNTYGISNTNTNGLLTTEFVSTDMSNQ